MNGWQRWWRAPGSHPLHRLLDRESQYLHGIGGLLLLVMLFSGLWLWLRRRRRLSGSAVPD